MQDNNVTPSIPLENIKKIPVWRIILYIFIFPIVVFVFFFKKMPTKKARIIYTIIVFVVLGILSLIGNSSSTQESQQINNTTPTITDVIKSTSTPSPTADQLAEYKAKIYIATQEMTTANNMVIQASKDGGNYDFTAAANDLASAKGNYDAAQTTIENANPPQEANHVQSLILEAVGKLDDAVNTMQNGVNDQSASEIQTGSNQYTSANSILTQAASELSALN